MYTKNNVYKKKKKRKKKIKNIKFSKILNFKKTFAKILSLNL